MAAMTDSTAPDLPPRPATHVTAEAPSTLHGMSRAQRDAVESALRRQVPQLVDQVGRIELVNSLMRLHDELAGYPQWDRVRVGLDADGEVWVSVHWLGNPGPAPAGCWLGMGECISADWLVEGAAKEGVTLDTELAEDLLLRAQELFTLSDYGRRVLGSLRTVLAVAGLTRTQLASPAALVFPGQADAIARYEEAFDAHARAVGLDATLPRPAAGSTKSRM